MLFLRLGQVSSNATTNETRKTRDVEKEKETAKGHNIMTSQEVTHPSTTLAQARLTAELRWDPVHLCRYDRNHCTLAERIFYGVYAAAKSRVQRAKSKEVASSELTSQKRRAKRALWAVARPPSSPRASMGFRPCVALEKGLYTDFQGQDSFIGAFW